MTQNDKDLLLRDLCARLPYGVKVQRYSYEDDVETIETLREIDSDGYMSTLECETLKHIAKPYLFPFSSMTEEQKQELNNLVEESVFQILHSEDGNPQPQIPMDWYNKNHFDYRGLIPMGLAIDATGLNIY